MVRVVVHRHGHLRRQQDVVAAAFERLADDLFGLTGGVDVGGVDEVDAASSAWWTMRIESSWSVLPQAPNIIVPRQSFETWTPVRPSGR